MGGIDNGWLEAAIAWEVCVSLHRQCCKGKDDLFAARQSDFVKHAENARRLASRGQAPLPQAAPVDAAVQQDAASVATGRRISATKTGANDMNTTQTETLAELIERLRSLSIDHGPKGWPAVRTRDVTALLDRIAELEAIGTTNAALHWIAFADQSPPKSAAEDDPSVQTEDCVLVTNNIYALDRMGRMSHVWWAFPGYDERNNEWYAYTDGRKIQAPTHWCDPMAVLRASHGQAPPQPAPTWDALHYAWRKIGCDVAGLDWGVFTNAAHYAPTPTAQAAESVLEGKP